MKRLFLGFGPESRRTYFSEEERSHHLHVIGSTGSGKSKFLEHLIRQDIRSGKGLCLIDPHGTLYRDVLTWCALRRESRPIVLLDPSAGDRIVGFNPFVGTSEDDDVAVQVERRIDATVRAWGVENTDSTPTLERWLRCLYHTLFEAGITLAESDYLVSFSDGAVRHYLTRKIETALIRKEWDELAALRGAKEFRDEMLSTKNRLMRLLASKPVLRFLALSEPRVDFEQLLESGGILLVNLKESRHLSGMNQRLLGAWLVNEVFETALRRSEKRPRPFYLYLDEFQKFVSHDIADMLAETRKFGLHAILAHQTLAQVREESEKLYAAVMGIARSKAVFGGLARADAQAMADEIFPGQVDYNEVKRILYSTQFWPEYRRDEVRTKTQARSSASGSGSATSSIAAGGMTSVPLGTEGLFFGPDMQVAAHHDSSGMVTASSYSEMSGSMDGESVADIPILYPVPRQVVTDEKLFTLEEQLRKLADNLKLQFTRHCFFKSMSGETHPLLVPKVPSYSLPAAAIESYVAKIFARTGARSPQEVDALFIERRRRIERAANAEAPPPPKKRKSTERFAF